jgi:hypothetical protein
MRIRDDPVTRPKTAETLNVYSQGIKDQAFFSPRNCGRPGEIKHLVDMITLLMLSPLSND